MVTYVLPPLTIRPGLAFPPVGAQLHDGGVTFRVWAPKHRHVRVATGDGTTTRYIVLERDESGFFIGRDEHGRARDTYWCQLDDQLVADPASRFQPTGVGGPSQVIDAASYRWRVTNWQRPTMRGRVIYELHVGTFTDTGTFLAAIDRLDYLRELGVNTIELMPVAEFAGRRNWGYDGVMLFAPSHHYGIPDELRALIDAAHERGLAVMIDVVYNHLGPCGNVLPSYSDDYVHPEKDNPWGSGLNFDGVNSRQVRELFLQNACMWLDEYRMDGLRLDAVHAIHDRSTPHLIAEIAAAAHARGAFVVAEDDRNEARIISPTQDGGWDVDAMWADDFHHVARVAITRQTEAYFANFSGSLDEMVDTLRAGWLYRGQYYRSCKQPRGTDPSRLPPERFVLCISNHDQVGNRPLGDRLSTALAIEQYRALSMLLCLVPYTPLLFMGQEWAAATPFPYFTDHPGEVGANMAKYRQQEFSHVGAAYSSEVLARMPDPQAEATFRSAKLAWAERERLPHAGVLELYRECLRFRAGNPIFQSPGRDRWQVEKRDEAGLALRWHGAGDEWVLILALHPGVEFVAPDDRAGWALILDSNDRRFGGNDATPKRSPGALLWRRSASRLEAPHRGENQVRTAY